MLHRVTTFILLRRVSYCHILLDDGDVFLQRLRRYIFRRIDDVMRTLSTSVCFVVLSDGIAPGFTMIAVVGGRVLLLATV